MDITTVPVAEIAVGERQRQVDRAKAMDLAKSIEKLGLLQPIGIKPVENETPAPYHLVFGAHRLQAMQILEQLAIAAYVLPSNLEDEEYLLIELQENSARHDLTGAQRKAYAAEIGRLCAILEDKGQSANGTDGWIMQMAQRGSIPRKTIYNWWQTFCQENGLDCTPRQALAVHKERFFTWLDAHQRQAEEEKARKAEDSFLAQRALCFQEVQEELQEVIALYGWEAVFEAVLAPLLEAHEERL